MYQFNKQLILFLFVIFGLACLGLLHNSDTFSTLTGDFRGLTEDSFDRFFPKTSQNDSNTVNLGPGTQLAIAEKPVSIRVSAKSILDDFSDVIAKSKATHDAVAAVTTPTFESVIKPLGHDENRIRDLGKYFVAQDVATDKAVRDAARTGDQMLTDYLVEVWMRADVYKAVKTVFDAGPVLGPEDERLLKKIELDYRRNGLSLPLDVQESVKNLQNQMTALSIAFNGNLADDDGHVWLTKEELTGVPDDLVRTWESRKNGTVEEYKMTFQYPDVFPTLQYASLEATRHKVWLAYQNRVPQNVKLMADMINLRQEVAGLMGFDNFANYVLEDRMSKGANNVHEFLQDLLEKVTPLALKDLEELKAIKKAEGNDNPLKAWDHRWTSRILKEQKFQFDEELTAEYFELNHTIAEVFRVYETLFSYKFIEVSRGQANFEIWHADVKQFAVYGKNGQEFLGWLFLDLFPRDGKFGHAAVMQLASRYVDEAGKVHHHNEALVCNFSKPSKTKPSLMKFDEVETFFHELGHALHELSMQNKWSRFDMAGCDRDFIESPSQMLENWCYDENVLTMISRHYKTGENLPPEMIRSIQRSRFANQGLITVDQIDKALFDQKIHTDYNGTTESDLTAQWVSGLRDVGLSDISPETAVHGESSFAHLMGGYEAGYYSYLWSEVYAADMFDSRFKGHELDPLVGAEYRDIVLRPGGTEDAMDYITRFLGRAPNNAAFLRIRGAT